MQAKSPKKIYTVVLQFRHEMTRTVKIKAVSREAAEKRALKFHPFATGVKRDAL